MHAFQEALQIFSSLVGCFDLCQTAPCIPQPATYIPLSHTVVLCILGWARYDLPSIIGRDAWGYDNKVLVGKCDPSSLNNNNSCF